MDKNFIISVIAFVSFIAIGLITKQIPDVILNFHAFFMVFGGSTLAMILNTPIAKFIEAIKGLKYFFKSEMDIRPEDVIPILVELADKCRKDGLTQLKNADPNLAGGFLLRVSNAVLEYNDQNFVKQVIEKEINQYSDEINEILNFYRTIGILAPMFGLLGTLIGIIGVLKDLSNPENVGPAMATAITSAFYGISFANVVCIPIAGKMRIRMVEEMKVRSMIAEGVFEIMKGSLPLVVERRLKSYIEVF